MSLFDDLNKSRPEQEPLVPYIQPKTTLDWTGFLFYLGYDLSVREDTERLFKNFIWLDKQRIRAEKLAAMRLSIFITILTALGTGFMTVLGSWLFKLIKP